jgi:hypothetical protein
VAGDWIKMSTDLRTHPKVVRIASALKADRLRVVGGLHAVWCLFDAHSEDGSLDGYSLEALDDLLGWPGFSAAMVDVGWIEESPQGIDLPRFENHNGQSAKRRAQETERKRMARAVADLSASDADKKRTREEKRREEKKEPARARKTPLPDGFGVSERVAVWASEKGYGNLQAQLEALVSHAKRNGAKYVDWDEALMNAVRSDWAKVNKPANGADIFAGAR